MFTRSRPRKQCWSNHQSKLITPIGDTTMAVKKAKKAVKKVAKKATKKVAKKAVKKVAKKAAKRK